MSPEFINNLPKVKSTDKYDACRSKINETRCWWFVLNEDYRHRYYHCLEKGTLRFSKGIISKSLGVWMFTSNDSHFFFSPAALRELADFVDLLNEYEKTCQCIDCGGLENSHNENCDWMNWIASDE